jgi:hypothetical protein
VPGSMMRAYALTDADKAALEKLKKEASGAP